MNGGWEEPLRARANENHFRLLLLSGTACWLRRVLEVYRVGEGGWWWWWGLAGLGALCIVGNLRVQPHISNRAQFN